MTLVSGLTASFVFAAGAFALPNVVQEHYRWRNDDGSESAASWKQNMDSAFSGQTRNENIRLRFAVANTSRYASADNYQYLLEYSTSTAGPWASVPVASGSDPFEMTTTSNYGDGDSTTNQLTGTGSFVAGRCVEDPSNATGAYSLANGDYTEFEYCFQATMNAVCSATYYFRLTNNGAVLDSYDLYPEIIIVPLSPTPTATPTPSITPTPEGYHTATPSPTPSPTPGGFKTPSPTPSVTPTCTPSVTPTVTPTPTPSATPSPSPSPTAPVEVLLSVGDSYVNQNAATTNYGTETTMQVRSTTGGSPNRNRRSFVEFDVSSIPSGATILSATARLYLQTAPSGSRSYDMHRVTASWIETSITWNNQPAVAGSPTDTIATGTSSGVWLEWDVTSDVQGYVSGAYSNYGWRVRDQVEDSGTDYQSYFRTREYTGTTYDPQLVVYYVVPTPTPTGTPTGTPTPSITPTPEGYETASPTPTATPTPEGYETPTPTPSPVITASPTPWQLEGIPSGYAEYYIPGSEEQMWSVYTQNDSYDLVVGDGMHAVISVTGNLDDTTLYYDHWENGYGFNPQSAFDTADVVYYISQGDVQIFESSNIPVYPRGTNVYWDGMDRIYTAGGPVTVTRMSWPESVGTIYADACELYPVNILQKEWTIPVGENLAEAPTSFDDFTHTYVMVQSTADNNLVQINDPWTAGTEVSVTLNRGQVTQLLNANSGTFVSASAPVQVQMMVGDYWASRAYESRWYTAFADSLWDKEYFCPVGGFARVDSYSGQTYYISVDIYLHNPHDFDLEVSFEDQSGMGSFTIFSHATQSYSAGAGRYVPVDSGVYLSAEHDFWGIVSGDPEYMGWDWGCSLVPKYALSGEYFLGWARGTSDSPPAANGNPIWITPIYNNTVVYVDYSPTDGSADIAFTLDRLESRKVFDPDNDNTGMHVWATDPIACAWGEDADTAGRSVPYLDLGYSCVPVFAGWIIPVLVIEKSARPPGVPFGVGETAWFQMTVSTYDYPVDDVCVWDWMPPGWNYVTGSTLITYSDWTTGTDDPEWDSATDPETLYWGLSRDMGAHEWMSFYYEVVTDETITEGLHRNDTQARGTRDDGRQVFSPIAYAYVYNYSFTIDKDTTTPWVEQSGVAHWTIALDTGPGGTKTNVKVEDTLPSGFTYLTTTSITWNDATRVSFSEPTAGEAHLVWGTWTIYTGGDLTIDFDAFVSATCPAGTYDNSAYCTSTESGWIDDDGWKAGDSDTPPGKDPEDDEDVTVVTYNGRCFDVGRSSLFSAETSSTSLVTTGLSATADLPATGAIAVFCSFASETVGGATTGTWDLRMDGTSSSQSIQRYLGPGGRGMGACINVFPSLGEGSHTVSLRHSTSGAANPVRTRDADLVVLPLTSRDEDVVLNYGIDTLGSTGDNTASSTPVEVLGLSANVSLDLETRIFVAAVINSESASGASKTASYDLTVDGVPVGVPVRRNLSGTSDLGIITLVGLSGTLDAGSHSVAVRHSTDAGTIKTSNGTLLAFSLGDNAGGHESAIAGRQVTFITQTGTESGTLTAIAWSESTMFVGDDDQILVASSFSTEHGADVGSRTALHDITIDASPVTQTGSTELSGTNDLSSSGLFGISDPLDEGSHTAALRHAVASPEILTGDATFVLLGVCCEQTPTAVEIKEFSAAGYDGLVAVEWETGAEIDSLGFYILRAEREEGPFRRINNEIIFSLGSSVTGKRYLFIDRGVSNGTTYYYELEEVDLSGESTFFGPVGATPEADRGTFTYDPAEYDVVVDSGSAPAPAATPSPLPTRPLSTPAPSPETAPSPAPSPIPAASAVPTPISNPQSLIPIIDWGDYDGDGSSDLALFRPRNGKWSIRGLTSLYFGAPGDIPASGDYDGDLISDIAFFRPASGLWAVRGMSKFYFGSAADLPGPADYDGDGITDAAVFRPASGRWAVRGMSKFYFGSAADLPVPADYDGDGTADAAVFKTSTGRWTVRNITRLFFGSPGDIPLSLDYDGDGISDFAVFRPSSALWVIRKQGRIYFGAPSDLPVPADYDGDFVDDIAVFRPETGRWAVRGSTSLYFGGRRDVPVTR